MPDAFAGVAYNPPEERWWQRYRREYWVQTNVLRSGTGEWERVLLPMRCIRSRFSRRLEALRLSPDGIDRAIPLPREPSNV